MGLTHFSHSCPQAGCDRHVTRVQGSIPSEEAITCLQEMLTRFSKWDRGSILFSSDSETEKTRQRERGRLREALRG